MIGNITSGSGARGLLNYVTEKDKAERIGGTMAGENARELSQEMSVTRNLKPNAANPVKHFSLSLPPGEHLSSEQWEKISHRYMDEMGYGNCQWIAYRHADTDKDHVHIAASRIDLDGKLVRESFEREKSQRVCRGIEHDNGLKVIDSSWQKDGMKQPTRGEVRERERTGKDSTRSKIQNDLRNEARGCTNIDEFRSKIVKIGIQTNITFDRNGQPKDILYVRGDFKIRGERLGPSLTLKGLDRAGVVASDRSFDHDKMNWDAYMSQSEVKPTSGKSAARDLGFIGKMRIDVATQRVESIENQIKEIAEMKAKNYSEIKSRTESLRNRSDALRTEIKTARIQGKDYRAAFRSINRERQELKRETAEVGVNASSEKLLLMREKYYAELRQMHEKFSRFDKAGTRKHLEGLSKIDAKYSKAFDREAISADKAFGRKSEFFLKTGNITWFSDKRLIRSERAKGVILAAKEIIRGVITGQTWRDTIRAAQERWAERSINARFGSDRNRGEAIRDLWKMELGRAQEERMIAFTGLARREAEAKAEARINGRFEAQEVAEQSNDGVPKIAGSSLSKMPEMSKEKAEKLSKTIAEVAKESNSFESFKSRLGERGIQVEINRRGSYVAGLVYAKDGEKAKASSLGHGLKQLEERGVDCGSVRSGGQSRNRHDAEAGRREIGGRPDAAAGRECEANRAETRGPEPLGTRDGAEAAKPGTDLSASRIEPSKAPRDHQRLGESEGRTANGREDFGRGLEGREGSGAGRDAAGFENRPRPDADRASAASADRPAERGRGAEPKGAPDASRPVDQPGSQSGRDAGRAPVVPPVQEVGPARASAEQRCNTFIAAQKEQLNSLENEKARLQGRVDQAKDQVGRELKPGEARVSLQERAELRDGLAKLEARIYQERSRMQEAAVLKSEGRAEQWSQGRDMEQKAQTIREGASQLPLAERSIKLAESHQLDSAAYTIKHGPDPLHGKAKDLGAAQWKAGRLMEGVNRLEKEGHIGKQDAAHIKDGFAGGWNRKQLVEAVKTLEGAGVHRDRPPEKAGQDMLKAACDAVQKCCGKGFDIGKGLEKGPSLSLDR